MHVYGIIPARYASTRLPAKPLAGICGKTMIERVYERASECARLNDLIVATDDMRIRDAVIAFGGACILTRVEHQSGTDRIAEAAEILGLAEEDVIVNIQGDEPLLEPGMIEVLVAAMFLKPLCDMATLAFPSSSREDFLDPNVVKVVADAKGRALYFSRSPVPYPRNAPMPTAFLKHLGFYAYRRKFLAEFTRLDPGKLENIEKLEQLRVLENGYSIRVALSPFDSIAVDTPEDLEKVVALIRSQKTSMESKPL